MATEEAIGSVLAGAIERTTDMVSIVGPDGNLLHLNRSALRQLGYPDAEIIGAPVLDLIHPDDLSTSTSGIAMLTQPVDELTVNPAYIRMRCRDGRYLRVEINGAVATDADGASTLVFIGRPTSDANLYEHLIELLTAGVPSAEAFAVVPEFGRWRQPSLLHAIHYLDDDGRPAAMGSEVLLGLGGIDDPTTPWGACALGDDDHVVDVADLAPSFRERAASVGLTHLRCRAVRDPLHAIAGVVVIGQATDVHGTVDAEVLSLMDYLFARMTTVFELVLAWRRQVVELRRSALTDPLTGLANRTAFWAGFERRASADDHDVVGLLYVDLDHFKAVNDVHGHPVGDALLVAVADRLRAVVRPGDLIARMGGDEFTVILTGSPEHASVVAERVVGVLAEPFAIDGLVLEVGASVGVAATPTAAFTPQDLLDAADRALYRAKATGRGRWCLEPLP